MVKAASSTVVMATGASLDHGLKRANVAVHGIGIERLLLKKK
jgi:hypothetical protein